MLRQLIASLIIVAICVVIHIGGIVLLSQWLLFNRKLARTSPSKMLNCMPVLILVFAIIILLHLTETAIWAAFYLSWQLFPDYETSLYFSLTSYTTIGFGDVVLPQKWRLLGGIEGFSGVLLCGLSTAYLFIVLNLLFQIRTKQTNEV